jgi:beta-phosphoglucomutase-like phosphatase (HAD superfamily)
MTRIRAIVFDMDGVLIDSEELHAHAKRIAFAHAGIALTHADVRAARAGSADFLLVVDFDQAHSAILQTARRSGVDLRLRRRFVVGHALLERLDALCDVAHDVGNLALAAEQQQRNREEQHPMPNAEATHILTSSKRKERGSDASTRRSSNKPRAEGDKNKKIRGDK